MLISRLVGSAAWAAALLGTVGGTATLGAQEPVTPAVNPDASATSPSLASGALFIKPKKGPDPTLMDQPAFREPVTLDFKNTDIQNVIRLIAAKSGLNILMDPSEVEGQVTIHLENVPLGVAMDNILKTVKLAFIVESGNIVRIVPEARVGRDAVETTTEVIELNWRNAKDIEDTFKTFLTSNGSMKSNEEAQALIITDVPPQVIKIRELINQVDRPDRQVMIDARLIDVQVGALRELGTRWSMSKFNTREIPGRERNTSLSSSSASDFSNSNATTVDRTTGNILGSTSASDQNNDGETTRDVTESFTENMDSMTDLAGLTGLSSVLVEGMGYGPGGTALTFGSKLGLLGEDYDLNAELNALEERRVVEVLANPRVVTLNNVQATIQILSKIPYIQGSVVGTGTPVETIEFEDAGSTIKVKPIITPDGHVRLNTDLQQDIFRGRATPGVPLSAPLIDERKAISTVLIHDRSTVLLGGLRNIENRDTVSGIPWLHRIPVFGWLFKNKSNDQARTELVLMLTPTIMNEATVNMHEKEMYDRIDTKWHLPDYFYDDVENSPDAESIRENESKNAAAQM